MCYLIHYLAKSFEGIATYALFILPTDNPTQWKKHRKGLQPAFGPVQLKHAFGIAIKVAENLFDETWKYLGDEGRCNVNINKHFKVFNFLKFYFISYLVLDY
jgi:cytochrome P450